MGLHPLRQPPLPVGSRLAGGSAVGPLPAQAAQHLLHEGALDVLQPTRRLLSDEQAAISVNQLVVDDLDLQDHGLFAASKVHDGHRAEEARSFGPQLVLPATKQRPGSPVGAGQTGEAERTGDPAVHLGDDVVRIVLWVDAPTMGQGSHRHEREAGAGDGLLGAFEKDESEDLVAAAAMKLGTPAREERAQEDREGAETPDTLNVPPGAGFDQGIDRSESDNPLTSEGLLWDRVRQRVLIMRFLSPLLVLTALAAVGCEPASVSFPADRGGRPDLEFLGLDLPEAPAAVDSEGTAEGFAGTIVFEPGAVRPNGHDGDLPQLPSGIEDDECGAVVSQSAWCVTLRDHPGPGSGVTFVGLDDGVSCAPLDASVAVSVLNVASLGLQGTTLAWCDASTVVHRVDLATGIVVTTANPSLGCGSMTSAAGGFAVLPQGTTGEIQWFARLSDILGGGAGFTWPFRPVANRIAADSQIVYAAEATTDNITRWLSDGTELEPLTLDDFGLIRGMDAAPGNRMVLLNDQRDLVTYDRITGAQLETIAMAGNYAGLACFPEP